MTGAEAYQALLAHLKTSVSLGQVAGLVSWDQEVMMPPKGAEARADQAGAMESVLHARRTDPRVAEWLAAVDPCSLDDAGRANLREARRMHERAVLIPADLAEELARTTARAQGIWAEARKANRFADFAPTLARVIDLTRQRAACLQGDGETLYDALIDDYEPGTTGAEIAETFGRLRQGLTALRERILGGGQDAPELSGTFPEDGQRKLSQELARIFGFDFDAGRLDISVHPFTSGTRGDTRITTRVDPANPFDCLYSTIHEVGHALYEQGLDPALAGQPAGNSVSMGVHESQSRFFENQIGRSRTFAEFLFPRMVEAFGEIGVASAQDLYRATNRVAPGFIRTEADEVHYNLHIMMRFDLERALISGDLQVADLEAAWNDRFEADFGRAVPDAANGVLQDVHWSVGLFGYFPTYTLGNLYAGCLAAKLRADLPGLDQACREGDLAAPIAWMREHVHRHGSIHMPRDLIAWAAGAEPDEGPLLAYLDAKFSDLYGL